MRELLEQPVKGLMVKGSELEPVLRGVQPAVRQLYVRSDNLEDLLARPRVAIVGSRKVTPYGCEVTHRFAYELAGAGVVIVSGLALGVDAIAHRAALEAGGLTMAVLPGGINKVYPASHSGLARSILEQGGALISEYAEDSIAYKNQFIERNRIVCGLSNVLLITEAAINSGTMHTARFALEQGKDVMAVPGAITSPLSAGTNNLIRSGAAPALDSQDILDVLGVTPPSRQQSVTGDTPAEQTILDLIRAGTQDASELLICSHLPIDLFNQSLTMLEITGKIHSAGPNRWAIQ